jgi:hypothetical protein
MRHASRTAMARAAHLLPWQPRALVVGTTTAPLRHLRPSMKVRWIILRCDDGGIQDSPLNPWRKPWRILDHGPNLVYSGSLRIQSSSSRISRNNRGTRPYLNILFSSRSCTITTQPQHIMKSSATCQVRSHPRPGSHGVVVSGSSRRPRTTCAVGGSIVGTVVAG